LVRLVARVLGCVLFCALVWVRCASVLDAQAPVRVPIEYQVKAAFLLNFAKFIEWPARAFVDEGAPVNICVFRYDPFGASLDEVVRGKNIKNRGLVARRVSEVTELSGCQLIFVSEKEQKRLAEVLGSVRGSSALVIGETEDFAQRGGGIQFFLEDQRLRFAINVDALQRARLTASSKLLALARIVHDSDVRDTNAKGTADASTL
jgi:uncharacterized protein DUF4154